MKPTVQNETNIAMASPATPMRGPQANEAGFNTGLATEVSNAPRLRIVARRSARWARRISHS